MSNYRLQLNMHLQMNYRHLNLLVFIVRSNFKNTLIKKIQIQSHITVTLFLFTHLIFHRSKSKARTADLLPTPDAGAGEGVPL